MKNIARELEKHFQTDISKIELVKCSNGDVNTTYIASYQSKKTIVKIQNETDFPRLYENQIQREEIGTRLCSTNGIPCPRIIASSQEEGYIITEFINRPLLGDVWSTLTVEEKISAKLQALSMIQQMNQIQLPLYGALYPNGVIGQFDTWEQSFLNIVDIALSDCIRYDVLSEEDGKQLMECASRNCNSLQKIQQSSPVFAHLDFHWKNIFYDVQQHRISCVFDFGSAMSTVNYMGFYRLADGFLYGTEQFYMDNLSCPMELTAAEEENAWLYNTLDYLTFLGFNGKEKNQNEIMRIRKELTGKK